MILDTSTYLSSTPATHQSPSKTSTASEARELLLRPYQYRMHQLHPEWEDIVEKILEMAHLAERTPVWRKHFRRHLKHLQRGKCYWCGVEMTKAKTKGPPTSCSYDHYYEIRDPRRHEFLGNVAACVKCNTERSQSQRNKNSYWGA